MTLKSALYRVKQGWRARELDRKCVAAERMTRDELAALNWERRVALVRYCADYVPYYKRTFKQLGFHYTDLRSEKDFLQLPLLDRQTVRNCFQELIATTVRPSSLVPASTGGTTGEPVTILTDPRVPLSSMSWRMLNWWGVDVSDNSGYLYRAVPTGPQRLLASVLAYPTRRAYISATDMTPRGIADFVRMLDRIAPRYLVGYVGALDAVATFMRRAGKRIETLKAVWTTAAPVPLALRADLDNVFGCPVYSQYGSMEVYTMAADCPLRQGLHVFSDIRHVELLAQPHLGSGCAGEVVVTDLTNYAFPLLRYRTGDVSRFMKTPCACGRPFPLMEYVQGRVSETIYLDDGTPVPGEYWTTIFDEYADDIRSFRVHQHKDGGIEITYEPVSEAGTAAAQAVLSTLTAKLGRAARIQIRQGSGAVNDRGKLRFVTSDGRRDGAAPGQQ